MRQKKQYVVAVDLGATNLRTALVDCEGKVRYKKIVPTIKQGDNGDVITQQIAEEIERFFAEGKYNIVGIGLAVAGRIDLSCGTFTPRNLPFKDVRLVEFLQQKFGVPAEVLNDANAGALGAQKTDVSSRVQHMVYITVSSGVGGGAIVDGRLLHGRNGNACNIGRIFVDVPYVDGLHDWEYYAAGQHIISFFKQWCESQGIENPFRISQPAQLFAHVKKRHRTTLQFVDELGKVHAQGIAALIATYSPDVIVMGGSVIFHNHEILLRYIKKHLRHMGLGFVPRIVVTKAGDNISLIGIAEYVFAKSVR